MEAGVKVIMVLGPSTGGIGTHVAQLSADLRERGVEVVVVTAPLTAAHFDLGPSRLIWPGAAGRARAVRDMWALRRLAASADIVHAHGHRGALLATLTTMGLPKRPRLIVSQHNAVLAGSGRQFLKRLSQSWVARRADLVTGASSDLVREALALGAGRAELAEVPSPRVPHLLAARPSDSAGRARIRQTLFISCGPDLDDLADSAAPLVVTISRIAPQKNLQVLLQAASQLREACTWVVVGEGDPELLAQLRERCRALGAPVHFVGSSTTIDQWLRGAEVFVLASQWEARALVVQEAMAAGTPVVASDVGGLHDLVDGTGLLVPPGDSGSIAKATDSLLADHGLREELAAHGRQVAAALPDGSDTVIRWLAWYSQTLAMT
jgi:glycosyltransferase involved in cell wall biosynthesis